MGDRGRTPAVLVGTALGAMALLHLAGWLVQPLDPLRHTVSDYVALPGGYVLLGLAALALAALNAATTCAARRAGAGTPTVTLLASWSAAMVVAAVFPTNAPGLPPDLVSGVHRWAGAWAFASLPVAAWLLARSPAVTAAARAPLARLAMLTGVLAAAFLLCHLPALAGPRPPVGDPLPIVDAGSSGFSLLGGVERVLYAVVIVLLLVSARAVGTAPSSAPAAVAGSVPAAPRAGEAA